MNLLEAYIKFIGTFVLYISGLPGSKVNTYGKELETDLKVPVLFVKDFYNDKENLDDITLSNGETIKNHYSEKLINYDKLNKALEESSKNGVVICGTPFDTNKLLEKYKINYHVHLAINKQLYVNNESDDKKERAEMKFDEVVSPYYANFLKETTVNKFVNVHKMENKESIYDVIWDSFIGFFKKALHQ